MIGSSATTSKKIVKKTTLMGACLFPPCVTLPDSVQFGLVLPSGIKNNISHPTTWHPTMLDGRHYRIDRQVIAALVMWGNGEDGISLLF
jgi:hypothetical protein